MLFHAIPSFNMNLTAIGYDFTFTSSSLLHEKNTAEPATKSAAVNNLLANFFIFFFVII